MEKVHQGVIRFLGYRMTDFQYHCKSDYVFPADEEIQYNFGFQKRIERLTENTMAVFLGAKVFTGSDESESPYYVSLELVGNFESDMEILPQWEANALAILFPYVRSIISSITSQSGMPPIILPTINLAQMFKEAEANN